ncbi:hypothetical protein [Agrobacterium vitis]|uniref:hypothetical protein n=1 Tax=Agrobacterium vitis TaxID=373 RepID=UPI000872412E|nr:hypothetical protein [Agrobacterium vitis]MCE6074259.1 hypothetical protein [Agrobacterium vitis]MCM2469090.1 hypothetical protein [Agrobacterium vitis]MUO71462.1 hypothetical protein [Agrobacterium vitis]MUO87042.1 hypothetical protein [Agrobacterium vitis]MVA34431.1 hypothetical protein [Agrobacterium vitis]
MRKEPITISLKQSLCSTAVEFLYFGQPLLDVANRLGPPKSWIANTSYQPVPLYWFYPGGLELCFEPEQPFPLAWFKLSDVGRHKGRSTRFSHDVRMRNDFPMADMSVSGFLRSGLWDLDKVNVGICAQPNFPTLDICIGCLRIPFLMNAENEMALKNQLKDAPRSSRLKLLDSNCDFFGAYFSPEDAAISRSPKEGWTTISGKEYLRELEQAS